LLFRSRHVNAALQSEVAVRQMRASGMEPLGGTPEEFARRIKSDTAQWDAVIKAAGLAK
jgi:tripartite-type tricarboxylate transporter receptor subunit TctC